MPSNTSHPTSSAAAQSAGGNIPTMRLCTGMYALSPAQTELIYKKSGRKIKRTTFEKKGLKFFLAHTCRTWECNVIDGVPSSSNFGVGHQGLQMNSLPVLRNISLKNTHNTLSASLLK